MCCFFRSFILLRTLKLWLILCVGYQSSIFGFVIQEKDIYLTKEKTKSDYFQNNLQYGKYDQNIKKTIPSSTNHIDNSIDPKKYFIGGGDEFTISLIGRSTSNHKCAVDQEGNLFIQELGLIKLGKITLDSAKIFIKKRLSEISKTGSEWYVSLSSVKMTNICITGAVESPGCYTLSGTMRLLDLIKVANGDKIQFNDLNLREIQCKSNDSIQYFDLFKYLLINDISQNPYIYPGDQILVEPVTKSVSISGPIKSLTSELIPIKNNESIGDLLSLFKLEESADTSKIILRTNENLKTKIVSISSEDKKKTILKDRDQIVIVKKENYPDIINVQISGEVLRPGTYPILENASTFQEILDYAGGITQYGDLSRAVVLRRNKFFKEIASVQEVRPEVNSAVAVMNLKRDYTVIRLNERNLMLETDDHIVVPKVENLVYISGAVKKPGAVPYIRGANKSEYIKSVGGYQKRADKRNVFIMTNYDNVSLTKEGEIEAGDIIVVPVSQQNKVLSTVVLPIISAVATTLGVLLAIYATVK